VDKLALNAGGCFIKLPGQQQKVVQCVRGEWTWACVYEVSSNIFEKLQHRQAWLEWKL